MIQELLVYLAVVLAVVFFYKKYFVKKVTKNDHDCGSGCKCD